MLVFTCAASAHTIYIMNDVARITRYHFTVTMSGGGKFRFAIDRGGTFTDVYAICPDGREKVMKLLSVDPANYSDAPREGIRRIMEEVR